MIELVGAGPIPLPVLVDLEVRLASSQGMRQTSASRKRELRLVVLERKGRGGRGKWWQRCDLRLERWGGSLG